MSYFLPHPQPQHTTPLWKAILAGLSIFFGAMGLLGLFVTSGFREAMGMFLISLGFIIPGAWFFLHERQAKQGLPMQRHWGKLSAAVVGILVAGGAILPEQPPEAQVTQFSSQLTSSSSPTSTTTTAETTSPITETSTPEITESIIEPEIPEAPEVTPEPEVPNEVMHNNFVNAPEPAPEPIPASAPVPAPAPAQSAYYGSCDAARAAGAAPLYAGSPGYSRKLDRDGDGVACE